jgi:hypothetical protein
LPYVELMARLVSIVEHMKIKIVVFLSLVLSLPSLNGSSINNLLKDIEVSGDGSSRQEKTNGKLKKIEKAPASSLRSDGDAYLVIKLDVKMLYGEDKMTKLLKSFVMDDDVCLALSGVSMITDTKPENIALLKDRFFIERNKNSDEKYSLTMMRADGSIYELSSRERFYSELSPIIEKTQKGNDYIRQREEAAIAAEKLSKESTETELLAFENHLNSDDAAIGNYDKTIGELKERGDLVFKKLYLGMPLKYVAARSYLTIVRVRTELSLFGFEFKAITPNEVPDRILVKFRDSVLSEILFDKDNKYSVSNGVYYRGSVPIRDVEVSSFTLDRDVLDAMFDTKDLKSIDILKQFCESYKIEVPAVWIPKREFRAGNKGLGVEDDYISIYNFSDKRGFNLTFACFDSRRTCSLILEKTKPRDEIRKSFD